MGLPEFISIFTVIFFGLLALFFALKEEKTKQVLLDRERKQKQRIYEVSILKEIQERIGYELNVEKVIDVITGSLRNLFPYSTTSSLSIKEDRLIFKTYVEESVSHIFLAQVKRQLVDSLKTLVENKLPDETDESISGVVLDDSNISPLSSFFNIPLVVNNTVVGIINVSSVKPGLYKEDEMTILYRITNQASSALSHLQQVLKTEKGKLMSLIGSLADGVFMLDTNNQVLVINDAAKAILKISKEEDISILDVLMYIPKDYDFVGKMKEVIIQNKVIKDQEIEIEARTFQVFITPVIDTNNDHVIGVSVLLHDVTLEKNMAKLKEDFTNMMVHELRSPLTAIKAASKIAISSDTEKQEQDKMLQMINSQSNLLLEYVSSLLDAAKIEAGRFVLQKQTGDIKANIEQTMQIFTPIATTKNIELKSIINGEIPAFYFDPVRIGQVLNNLVSNSLKFTREGGTITITASFTKEENDKGHLLVSVSDTGVGIPKEKQSTLFSKFSQVLQPGQVVSQPGGSTGLGLYITKGIVESHGGKVSLKSEPGHGTTISITLPAGTTTTSSVEHNDGTKTRDNFSAHYGNVN